MPMRYGKSWMSFLAEPAINMSVVPTIGDDDFPVASLPKVRSADQIKPLIKDLIVDKFKKMTFPNKSSIEVPLSCP